MNFVIGDIQGCYAGLLKILKKVNFNPNEDTLWAVGDLVARGEDSLSTLLYLEQLGPAFKAVLGNHDLHLLSVANGIKPAKPSDRIETLLHSRDLPRLVEWLRHFPLARKIDNNLLLVHAGLYPKWSAKKALSLSSEVEQRLQQSDYANFLSTMYGAKQKCWKKAKNTEERLQFIVNAMTRMRYMSSDTSLDFNEKCAPDLAPTSLSPWFKMNNPKLSAAERIVFGHWATLQGETSSQQFIALDTGYVWGGAMTLWCVEQDKFFTINH